MQNSSSMTIYGRLCDFCLSKGLRMTAKRRIIADIVSHSKGHPDVVQIFNRARKQDPRISLATVYRTLKLFESANLLDRHNFFGGKSRFESIKKKDHFHLIDVDTGKVIEFQDENINRLKHQIANRLGYALTDFKLELFGKRLSAKKKNSE